MERVALAIWNERISPVFDVSRRLLVLEIDAGQILTRTEVALDPDHAGRKAATLAEREIETLICGSISRCLAGLLASRGIRLLSFVTGPVEEVITAYLEDALPRPSLIMPGCCCARWRQQSGSGATVSASPPLMVPAATPGGEETAPLDRGGAEGLGAAATGADAPRSRGGRRGIGEGGGGRGRGRGQAQERG